MTQTPADAAREEQATYATEEEREAFADGYDFAHGIACHNVPKKGETHDLDGDRVTIETVDDAREVHDFLCFEAEMLARCYSPWEQIASRINALEEQWEVWKAYDAGVAAAIAQDLAGYGPEQYGFDD